MTDFCMVCNKKINFLSRLKIKNGFICVECNSKSLSLPNRECYSAQDYLDRFAYLEEHKELFSKFSPTININNHLQVDEQHQLFKIGKSVECFPFSCLINFELNEDGETITKGGLGSVALGGALFGSIGAVVGGVTGGRKSKSVVNNMYIRISLNDRWTKTTKISIISCETKKGGLIYNDSKSISDRIISTLEFIVNQQEDTNNIVIAPATYKLC